MAVDSFNEQYELVTTLAEDFISNAGDFLSLLSNMASRLSAPLSSYIPSLPDYAPPGRVAPNIGDVSISDARFHIPNILERRDDLNYLSSPNIPIESLGQITQSIPDPQWSVPNLGNVHSPIKPHVSFPHVPSATLPKKPSLLPITEVTPYSPSFPDAPSIELPVFDESPPDISKVETDIERVFTEIRNILPRIQSSDFDVLMNFFSDRSINMSAPVMPNEVLESLVRAHDAELAFEFDREVNSLLSLWSSRGFNLPAGIAARQVKSLTSEYLAKKWAYKKELLLKQFDVNREELRFYAERFSKMLFDIVDIRLRMAEVYSKLRIDLLGMAVKVYELIVMVYKTVVDSIRTKVELYGMMIQAEEAKIRAASALLENEKLKVSVNESLVRMYVAELDSVKTLYDTYRTSVDAAKAVIEAYATDVQAFRSAIEAEAIKLRIPELENAKYLAKLKGEELKTQISKYNADLKQIMFTSKVEVEKLRIETQRSNIALLSERLSDIKTRIEALRSISEAVSRQNSDTLRWFEDNLKKEELLFTIGDLQNKENLETFKTKVQGLLGVIATRQRNIEANMHAITSTMQAQAHVASAGGTISASVISSAISSLNAIVQLVESLVRSGE